MKQGLKNEREWFMHLSFLHKVYFVYWLISFMLLFGVNEYNPMWLCILIVINFGNSVRLINRVPCDDLED